MVLFYHLGHRAWAPPIEQALIRRMYPDAPAFPELEAALWLGWVGVEIFFVLSGFVIAYSAERSTPAGFFRSRTLRLAPAIVICATVTTAVLMLANGFEPRLLITYARTLALPLFPAGPWIDSVYWSLIVEIVFYSTIFALLAFRSFSRVEWLACLIGLGSSAVWFANAFFGFGSGFLADWVANVTLARHGCFLAAGVFLWLMLFKEVTLFRLAVLVICLSAGMLEIADVAAEKEQVIGRAFNASAAQIVFLLGVVAIAASTTYDHQIKAVLGRGAAILPWLGLMTYPLYLVHNFVGVTLMNGLAQAGAQRHVALLGAASLVIFLSFLITRMAEPAVRSVLRNAFSWIGERWAEQSSRWAYRRIGPRPLQAK